RPLGLCRPFPTRRSSDLARLAVVHAVRADGGLYLGPFPGVAPARFVRSAIEAALPVRRGGPEVVELIRRGLTGESDVVLLPLARSAEHTSELPSRENLVC